MNIPAVLFSFSLMFQTEGGLTYCFCLCRPFGTCSFISTICHHKEQGGQCHSTTVAKPSGNTYLCLVVWKQHRGLYSLWTDIKLWWRSFLTEEGGKEWSGNASKQSHMQEIYKWDQDTSGSLTYLCWNTRTALRLLLWLSCRVYHHLLQIANSLFPAFTSNRDVMNQNLEEFLMCSSPPSFLW